MTWARAATDGTEVAEVSRVRLLPIAHLASIAAALLADPPDADAQATCRPPTVMVVLDKSSSMQTGTINGVTKWSIARNALGQVMTELQSKAEVGLMTFPRPDRCGPGGLDVAPALNSRTAIMNALGSPPPASGFFTPMAQTLEAAALEPTLIASDAPRYVVVISDGWQWCSPYDPATRYDGVDAIGSLNGEGVTTYVVGFGGATDASALNLMAVEAGTARSGCNPANDEPSDPNHCYYQADDATALIAALQQIADNVAVETCDGEDNDCDGLVDEGLVRDCATACGSGSETCTNGAWGGCDAPAVETEVCNGSDDNCDGAIDPGCDCTPGTTRPCGETSDVGACQPGTQTCNTGGHWGNCEGSVSPTDEMCNGLDDDCDGHADEDEGVILHGNGGPSPLLCQPGEVCLGGACVPEEPVIPPSNEEDPTPSEEGGQPGGCGCNTSTPPTSGFLLLALGALIIRRRR